MKILCCLLLGMCSLVNAAPPVISNIRVAQRPGTKLVDIYYDLSDTDGDLQLIQVAASADAGLTYALPCTSLTGAVGAGVALGTNRHIVWDAGADWNGNWVPQCRVRVTTHDGTTPPAPPGMAYIPPGPFQMGDNLDGTANAMPVHSVQVDGFFMDKYLVTKELWQSVQTWANNNGYSINTGSWRDTGHPVSTINWYDAVKWCNARSQKEGLTPCYYTDAAQTLIYKTGNCELDNTMVKWTANGYRLPTEAEWEKAARGGVTGQRFPWGDSISHSQANFYNGGGESYQTGTTGYHPTYGGGTSPVGSFAANAYGLFDMAGNLWEWNWDWWSTSFYGAPESLTNPRGPVSGSYRVLRGGYWAFNAGICRVSGRYYYYAGYADYYGGFRSVRR
ncbi:MAG: SUMF1/EgtB/PvdO family nonheme iron enzyme [Verrucomicrobiota bacterium]